MWGNVCYVSKLNYMILNKKLPISRWFTNKISHTVEQKELKWLLRVLYFPHLNIFESLIFFYNITQFNFYSGNMRLILKCLWNGKKNFKCIFYFIFLWSVAEGMTALRHFIQTLSKKKTFDVYDSFWIQKKEKNLILKVLLEFFNLFFTSTVIWFGRNVFSFFLFVYFVELRRVNLIQT